MRDWAEINNSLINRPIIACVCLCICMRSQDKEDRMDEFRRSWRKSFGLYPNYLGRKVSRTQSVHADARTKYVGVLCGFVSQKSTFCNRNRETKVEVMYREVA